MTFFYLHANILHYYTMIIQALEERNNVSETEEINTG